MIEGIDIFQPRDSGLPDLSRISAAQIFNGSALAGLNAMKEQHDPYGLLDRPQGVAEAVNRKTTIDSTTGRRVEVRRARVVEELLNGKSAQDRGHRKVSERRVSSPSSSNSGVYSAPMEQPDLPESPTELDNSLLSPPPADVETGPSSGILPPELLELPKTSWLRKLPTTVLEELKNLYNV